MTLQEEYQITVEAFSGPLDLLLYLVRRAEVDIQDIPIARITDQYLELLGGLPEIDIDLAGEFLVMAATLIEIKSRTLMPVEARSGGEAGAEGGGGAGEPDDPRQDLIQQLLAYQRFRLAAEALEARRIAHGRRFAARPAALPEMEAAPPEVELELEDVHLLDLADAYQRIVGSIDFSRLGDHRVEVDDTPIALYQEDLLDRLGRADTHRLKLQDVFAGHGRVQRIGLFLATLELVRQRRVNVLQDEIDGPIEVVLEE